MQFPSQDSPVRSPRLCRRRFLGLLVATGASGFAVPASAETVVDPQGVVNRAERTVRELRAGPQGEMIGFLLERSVGAMVFPRLIRVGFLLGATGGNGVLLGRDPTLGWSPPAFVGLGAGSVGLQIGAQSTRALLIIMDQATVDRALATSLRLGADASVSVGTDGLTGQTTTQALFEDVHAFVQTEAGLYLGVSLEGAVIDTRHALNRRYYGGTVEPREVVLERKVANPGAERLMLALS